KNADTAVIYGWLAAVAGEEKGIDHAIEYQQKVVETQKALYGNNSPEAQAAIKACEGLERKKSGKGPAPIRSTRRRR
ncbi:MAG TPA: tetratricopeptide repeat protein, partial [Trichormus sp.]